MTEYEYMTQPAPTKGVKARGVKTAEARFAFALQEVLNAQAAEGWEFWRAETLPHVERTGLTGTQTTFRSVLIFRRALAVVAPQAPAPTPSQDTAETPRVLTPSAEDGSNTSATGTTLPGQPTGAAPLNDDGRMEDAPFHKFSARTIAEGPPSDDPQFHEDGTQSPHKRNS